MHVLLEVWHNWQWHIIDTELIDSNIIHSQIDDGPSTGDWTPYNSALHMQGIKVASWSTRHLVSEGSHPIHCQGPG